MDFFIVNPLQFKLIHKVILKKNVKWNFVIKQSFPWLQTLALSSALPFSFIVAVLRMIN